MSLVFRRSKIHSNRINIVSMRLVSTTSIQQIIRPRPFLTSISTDSLLLGLGLPYTFEKLTWRSIRKKCELKKVNQDRSTNLTIMQAVN